MHLVSEPVHLPPGVEEDDGLGDCQSLVQVTQSLQLPLLQTWKWICSDQTQNTKDFNRPYRIQAVLN